MDKERILVPLADFGPLWLPIQPTQRQSPEEIPIVKLPNAALRIMELSVEPAVCAVSERIFSEAVFNQMSWQSNLSDDASVNYKRGRQRWSAVLLISPSGRVLMPVFQMVHWWLKLRRNIRLTINNICQKAQPI